MPDTATDAVVSDLLELLEESLGECISMRKSAEAFQKTPQVILQKVATAALDVVLLDETLRVLVDTAYLAENDREKMAAELQKNPNGALRLAARIATLSTPGHESGQGVKSASVATPTASSEWDKVVTEGA